jgi:hypothetical protein
MKQHELSRVSIVIGAILLTGALAAAATAVLTADPGGAQVRVEKRTNNVPTSTSSTVFTDLPGANVVVAVPANASRLFDVPFFAESKCAGPGGGGWCSVRIIATNIATGASVELNPMTGLDYAFDSDMAAAADDLWEGHGMERSRRLPGGPSGANYRIRVQFAVTNNTIAFTLDDWHLAVQTNL